MRVTPTVTLAVLVLVLVAVGITVLAAVAVNVPGSGVALPSAPLPSAPLPSVAPTGPGRGVPLPSAPLASSAPTASGGEVLLGAGDIGTCSSDADEATARLLDGLAGTVFTAGDNAYERGRLAEFERCYAPTWGRHLARTRFPAPGNHDWDTTGAAGYLEYYGTAARPEGTTWYSGDLGAWHVVVLDSECAAVGSCPDPEAQLAWLRDDLGASDARCTIAIWHHPRFSSGDHGNDARLDPIWRLLHDAGVEIVVNGHDHDYERFAPQDPDGQSDPDRGIRQFVVGTGGAALRPFREVQPNSEVRDASTHGLLRLELGSSGYAWTFVPIEGRTFTDDGTGTCH